MIQFSLRSTGVYLFLLLSVLSLPAISQEKATVKGVIKDVDRIPIEGVAVTTGGIGSVTNTQGAYSFKVEAGSYWIHFLHVSFIHDSVQVELVAGDVITLDHIMRMATEMIPVVDVGDDREGTITIRVDPRDVSILPGPDGSVEGLIKTLPGVVSTSELSSQYSVRGGNFDENLIYVNDIEIYRPFLVRSGQQEGLSFINTDMVSSVEFSTGGFESKYGDKMSSVLNIKYLRPKEFFGHFQVSLLGASATVGEKINKTSYLIGARYHTNQLLLGSLDTRSEYRPQFFDLQFQISQDLSARTTLHLLGNIAQNRYDQIPQTRQTQFGTITEALQLNVFFNGQERDRYSSGLGALSLEHFVDDQTLIKFIISGYVSSEEENFDIEGQYRLSELENNLGSDDFGEIKFTRGVGTQHVYARNKLYTDLWSIAHRGIHSSTSDDSHIEWGVKFQSEYVKDRLKEWFKIDSSGYTLPYSDSQPLELFESIDTRNLIESYRITAFGQADKEYKTSKGLLIAVGGIRFNYWSFSDELVISPRGSLVFHPKKNKDMEYNLAVGAYHQPPFYREIRNYDGDINEDIKAQRSFHLVAGMNKYFRAWDRPFKFTTEVYYKWMSNIIPYQIDNLRIRYYGTNNASGFATGIDLRVNGEFVKGVDSWASLSVMTIQEDLEDDSYVDANGNTVYPGFIPKPMDRRVNFSIFFQDYFPNDPSFRVHLNLLVGTGLPFGPPRSERYEQVRRMPAYRRVDIGFSKVLLDANRTNQSLLPGIKSAWIALEVFNLLQVRNTISYTWVQDVNGGWYGVPNYLTNRLLNIKLNVSI